MRISDWSSEVCSSDLWKLRWAQDNGLAASALYRLGKSGRSAVELGLAWPLRRTPLDMNGSLYLQYFQGYGETLLGSSEERRVGQECVSPCRSRWSPCPLKKQGRTAKWCLASKQ